MEIEFLAGQSDGVGIEVGEVRGGLELDFAVHFGGRGFCESWSVHSI